MDLQRTALDVGLVILGFILALIWDRIQRHLEWKGHKDTLRTELKTNELTMKGRFQNLPSPIQDAIRTAWAGGQTNVGLEVVAQLPALSLVVELKTSAWDSIVSLGYAPRLKEARPVVAAAYEKIYASNHSLALSLPLYELSLNPEDSQDNRNSFRQGSQMSAVFPELFCLPLVREALEALE